MAQIGQRANFAAPAAAAEAAIPPSQPAGPPAGLPPSRGAHALPPKIEQRLGPLASDSSPGGVDKAHHQAASNRSLATNDDHQNWKKTAPDDARKPAPRPAAKPTGASAAVKTVAPAGIKLPPRLLGRLGPIKPSETAVGAVDGKARPAAKRKEAGSSPRVRCCTVTDLFSI
jgi:hypothetical protein